MTLHVAPTVRITCAHGDSPSVEFLSRPLMAAGQAEYLMLHCNKSGWEPHKT